MRSHTVVAKDLIHAVTSGDVERAGELYADDAVLWQNTSGKTVDKARALRTIAWLFDAIQDLRYEDVRITETPTGFVQQHRLCGQSAAGGPLNVPAVMIATIQNGRIVRIDEYMDSAHLAPLMVRA